MSDSLDYLSFSEPSTVGGSSRQFLTQTYEQFSSDGQDRFYRPGESTRIEVSGMSQNSFILPRTMKLVYHACANTQTLAVDPGYQPVEVADMRGISGLRAVPGVPFYGSPFVASIVTEVPGLSSNLSALNADGQSQRWYTQRLLCSGDEGECATPGYKPSFGQKGRAFAAGGRDLQSRADGVTGTFWRQVVDGSSPPAVKREWQCGGFQRYDCPASSFLDLADGCSSVLPLPYLTSSSSNLLVRVNWAPVGSAVVTDIKAKAADLVTYAVGGVSLQWTAVNIIDSSILASIQSLFRGEVALPIAEGLTVPVPMTLSHRAYRFASTTLPQESGSVSIRVPAGQAACNAVMVKIDAIQQPIEYTVGGKFADHNMVSAKPIIKGMVLRVGSARYNAREISDVYSAQAPGLGAKWALMTTSPADAENDDLGGPTFIATSDDVAAEQYKQGRQFFSLFDNDSYDCSPASALFDGTQGPSCASRKAAVASSLTVGAVPGTFSPVDKFKYASNNPNIDGEGSVVRCDTTSSPNMFIFNLQALMPEMSLRERGYGISGVDLRSQCDITLEFTIERSAPQGVNWLDSSISVPPVPVTGWDISTSMSYTELATLLPQVMHNIYCPRGKNNRREKRIPVSRSA